MSLQLQVWQYLLASGKFKKKKNTDFVCVILGKQGGDALEHIELKLAAFIPGVHGKII